MRIIVGAGGTSFPDWLSFNEEELDIRDPYQWAQLFEPESLDRILAEHVWEHLNNMEGFQSARNAHRYLKPGGVLRVAVPDGKHPDLAYINWVRPGNWLNGDDHKVLYTAESLSRVLSLAGFTPIVRECWDDHGNLWSSEMDLADGYLFRACKSFWTLPLSLMVGAPYSSLVIDGVKG